MFSLFPAKNNLKNGSMCLAPAQLDHYLEEISSLLSDDSLFEIYIHGSDRNDQLDKIEQNKNVILQWRSSKVAAFIAELAWGCKVRIDPFRPYAGGVLPGRSWRWHAIIAPMTSGGPILVLRKQRFDVLDLSSFVFEGLSASSLVGEMSKGISVVIFGATGSGKTTLLMSLLKQYFTHVRLGIAEVVEEIPLLSSHWFRILEVPPDAGGRGGVAMTKVLSEMMRLSPKVIAVGEVRGDEARIIADMARTGHGGVLTTLHAGGFEDARTRLSTLAGLDLSQFPPLCGAYVSKIGDTVSVRSERLN
jgi:Flp pilus assembly CpaF family ATPase